MRYLFIFILLIAILSQSIDAKCKNSQVDINTATIEELDELYGIGPVKAQAIVDSRTFESVDDLINVKGIGEITLEKIKDQDLACVDDEDIVKDKENKTQEEEIDNKITSFDIKEPVPNKIEEEIEAPVIELFPKNIKTDEDNKNPDKNYAIFGFIAFCILLAFLFVLKLRRDKLKNEFS